MTPNLGADGFQSSEQFLKRDRSVLGEIATDKQDGSAKDRKKVRKSMGRRVSFAPDAQLETMHLYPKDKTPDQNRNPLNPELDTFAGAIYQPNIWQRDIPEPSPTFTGSVLLNDSPHGSTMDLTGNATADFGNRQMELSRPPQEHPGDVTAGVPSLAELAHSDGDTDQYERMVPYNPNNVTDAVPSLGTLLEEDEAGLRSSTAGGMTGRTDPTVCSKEFAAPDQTQEVSMDLTDAGPAAENSTVHSSAAFSIGGYTNVLEAGQHPLWGAMADKTSALEVTQTVERDSLQLENPSPAVEGPPEQVNTWGFVPGDDDTQDLNLASKGRTMMGENTYNQIYGNNDTTVDIAQAQLAEQPAAQDGAESTDELLRKADDTLDSLRSAMKSILDSPGGFRRRSSFGLGSGRSSMRGRLSEAFDAGSTPRRQLGRPSSGFQDAFPPLGRFSDAFSDGGLLEISARDSPASASPALVARTPVGHPSGASALRTSSAQQPGSSGGEPDVPNSGQGQPGFHHASQPGSGDDPWSAAAKSARRASVASLSRDAIVAGATEADAFEDGAMPVRRVGEAFEGMLVSGQKGRRTSAGSALMDNTGKLLEDDTMDSPLVPSQAVSSGALQGDQPLPSATPGPRTAGKDMTTRLLLEDNTSGNAPGLQIKPQQVGSMVQLLAFNNTSSPAAGAGLQGQSNGGVKTPATTRLLADSRTLSPMVPLLVPQAPQALPLTADLSMGLSMDLDRESPGLLRDQTMDGFDVPPEPGWEQRFQPAPALTPTPSMFAGGLLLQRTPPVSTRPRPSQPAAPAEATPEPPMTRARSQRSASPAGGPAYPSPNGPAGPGVAIPGNVKLARTPTRASSRLALQSPAPPQSAAGATPKPPLHPRTVESTGVVTRSSARPGGMTPPPSTVSRPTGPRVARTPIGAVQQPVPITLQDFLKEVDIQFLDHMRRGASINLADLASDPPPATLQDSYKLMCITAPEVTQYEAGIATLHTETANRKAAAKEKEAQLAENNPAIFQQIQMASGEDHEALKGGSQALKKLCRLRTTVTWKEWRANMEAERGRSLQNNLQLLQRDNAFLQNNLNHLMELGNKVGEYSREATAAAALVVEQHLQEAERRRVVLALRDSLAEQQAANKERQRKRADSAERLASLKAKHAVLGSKREQLQGQLSELQASTQAQPQRPQSASPNSATPEDVINKIEQLDILEGCLGWSLESSEADSSVPGHSVVLVHLKFGKLFRFEVTLHKDEQSGDSTIEGILLLLPEDKTPTVPAAHRLLAANLVQDPAAKALYKDEPSVMQHFSRERATSARVTSIIRGINTRVGRVTDLLAELDGLILRYPALAGATLEAGGNLCMAFLNLELYVKFSATLRLGQEYWEGVIPCQSRVHFAGPAGITPAGVDDAVAAVAPCYGRLDRICATLSLLAAGTGPSLPEPAADGFLKSPRAEDEALPSQPAAEESDVSASAQASAAPEPSLQAAPPANAEEPVQADAAKEPLPESTDGKQTECAAAEQPAPMDVDADAAAAEAALQVFSNPLFNSATPGRLGAA